ncbi:NYN domain-containing protein [Candidatus Amesbacteria bacterium]|nr:NYN domain-containing protein [Candidatus Amesbacteria bacterium]MBI2587391.1 NYN domain-containing protein [Candidatus Amesbacteria bacterium]
MASKKTFLYIDGTNLFAGQNELFGPKKYLSFNHFVNDLNKILKIDKIYFYASYLPTKGRLTSKHKSLAAVESLFYRDVKSTPNLEFYKGHRSPASGKEKGVDVHLAVDMVKHAFESKCRTAIIISGDADLSYPIEIAKVYGLQTMAVFLPNRFALGISHKVSKSFVLNYKKKFRFSSKDLPKSLTILELKDPACKHTG